MSKLLHNPFDVFIDKGRINLKVLVVTFLKDL